MKIIDKLRNVLILIVEAIFGLLVVLTIAQVFMRYVVGHAFMWGDELMRVLLIWGVLLSGGLAIYHHRHLALDYLLNALPKKIAKILQACIWCLIIAIGVFFVFQGWKLATKNYVQMLPTLHYSMFYLQISLPISALLWIIFSVNNIYCLFAGKEQLPLHKAEQTEENPPKEGN